VGRNAVRKEEKTTTQTGNVWRGKERLVVETAAGVPLIGTGERRDVKLKRRWGGGIFKVTASGGRRKWGAFYGSTKGREEGMICKSKYVLYCVPIFARPGGVCVVDVLEWGGGGDGWG